MPKTETLIGQTYGRLTVISKDTGRNRYYSCKCSCGTVKSVRKDHFIHGRTVSCGCYNREKQARLHTIHGHTPRGKVTSEYRSYTHMITRCYNPKIRDYHRYGGRGIEVCERWRNSFKTFLKDMGAKPKPKRNFSLDRIDSNGNYEPSNCRWATNKEQSINRSTTRFITYNNETLSMRDWSIRLGGNKALVQVRLRDGWSEERAVSTPVQRH